VRRRSRPSLLGRPTSHFPCQRGLWRLALLTGPRQGAAERRRCFMVASPSELPFPAPLQVNGKALAVND
jgi:hypothetical protein